MTPAPSPAPHARLAYSTGGQIRDNHLSPQGLERCGLAYICERPGILFSKTYTSGNRPVPRVYCTGVADKYDSPNHDDQTLDGTVPDVTDGMLMRVLEAYQILSELYAPHSAQTTGPRPRQGPLTH